MQRVAGASQRRRESHFARHFFSSYLFFFLVFFLASTLDRVRCLISVFRGVDYPHPLPILTTPNPPLPQRQKKTPKKEKKSVSPFGIWQILTDIVAQRQSSRWGEGGVFFLFMANFFSFFLHFSRISRHRHLLLLLAIPTSISGFAAKKKKDEDGALGRHSFVLFLCSRCKKNDSSFFSFLFFHRVWQQWPRATAMTHPKIGF